MAENGNSTETPVDVVATNAPEETPAASAKGKGKAVASEVQDDVAMDDDDDDDEDDDEVSSFCSSCAPPNEFACLLTNTLHRPLRMVCELDHEPEPPNCNAICAHI